MVQEGPHELFQLYHELFCHINYLVIIIVSFYATVITDFTCIEMVETFGTKRKKAEVIKD